MSKLTYLNFATFEEMDKEVKLTLKAADTMRGRIQVLAVGIVSFAALKGSYNVTRAKTLVDGLVGFKQDALIEFFSVVGINFDEEGAVTCDKTKMTVENLNLLKDKHWYEYKKTNPYSGFDLSAVMIKTLKQAYIAMNKDGDEAKLVTVDLKQLAQLEAMIPADLRPKKPAMKAATEKASNVTNIKPTDEKKVPVKKTPVKKSVANRGTKVPKTKAA
jgi:hypothetical protein